LLVTDCSKNSFVVIKDEAPARLLAFADKERRLIEAVEVEFVRGAAIGRAF